MAPAAGIVPGGSFLIWGPDHGPFCITRKQPTAPLFVPVPSTRGRGVGCPLLQLAPGSSVCFSTHGTDIASDQSHITGEGGGDSDCTSLAKVSVVRGSGQPVSHNVMEDSSRQGLPQPGSHTTSRSPVAAFDCVAVEQRLLKERNFLAGII